MIAYVGVAAQVFIGIVQLVQIVVVWVLAKQIGARFDIHIWRNGQGREE